MNQSGMKEVFSNLYRDGKLGFIILASLLISVCLVQKGSNDFLKSVLIAVPYGFGWVIFAWAITDRSVLRRPIPYIGIFFALFLEKMFWSLNVRNIIPSSISADEYVSYISKPHMVGIGFEEELGLQFVFLKFIVVLFVFMLIWYLSKPKDFKNRVKMRNGVLIFLSSFFMIGSYWIWELFGSIDSISYDWYVLLFIGIPIAVSLLLLSLAITNIKNSIRYYLYCGVSFFAVIPFIPFYKIFYNFIWDQTVADVYIFIMYIVSYFGVFLCLLLLSKNKYLE